MQIIISIEELINLLNKESDEKIQICNVLSNIKADGAYPSIAEYAKSPVEEIVEVAKEEPIPQPVEEPKEEPVEEVEEITFETLKDFTAKLLKTGKKDKVLSVYKKYNTPNLKGLDEMFYSDYYKDIKEL